MGHPASQWKHKSKYKGRVYVGKHERNKRGKREFVLLFLLKNGDMHDLPYESHEAAKRDGWYKVK